MNAQAASPPRWDLDRITPGGVSGAAWREALAALHVDLAALRAQGEALGPVDGGAAWAAFLGASADADQRLRQLSAGAWCEASVRATDPAAAASIGAVEAAAQGLEAAWTGPEAALAAASEEAWTALLSTSAGAAQADGLRWRRVAARARPPADQQRVAVALSDGALHAWGRRYNRVSAKVVVQLGAERLSHGQAFNRLGDPDAAVRRAAQAGIAAGWAEVAEDCAEALDQIIGARAVLADLAGRDPLDEALDNNRISRPALDALLAACAAGRPALWRALDLRARLLGVDRVDWADLSAPVGGADAEVPWAEAEATILRCFSAQSPAMGAFAARAFGEGWIEAEDRGGKRHGAFCISLPAHRESRVFMTYSGRTQNLITLAHELGHAYHNDVLMGEPAASRSLPYTLAETASTFAEAVVRGDLLAAAEGTPAELPLLDQELQSAVIMLLNIPMRFALERALFEMKAQGSLRVDALKARAEALQREAYGPVLGEAHPMFWAEKLHFYLTRAPYYNFPYAFGYFFSALVYAKARAGGPAFAPRYAALLADTGRCTVEEVAMRHLGVDLTDPAAWAPVIAEIERLVERYAVLVAGLTDGQGAARTAL